MRVFSVQRTAWYPPIDDKGRRDQATEAVIAEELSEEQQEAIRAERKQQVLAGLRKRIAGMSGAHARTRALSLLSRSLSLSLVLSHDLSPTRDSY